MMVMVTLVIVVIILTMMLASRAGTQLQALLPFNGQRSRSKWPSL